MLNRPCFAYSYRVNGNGTKHIEILFYDSIRCVSYREKAGLLPARVDIYFNGVDGAVELSGAQADRFIADFTSVSGSRSILMEQENFADG